MPRFYFHLFNDVTIVDQEGEEAASDDAAIEAATRMAREMAAESVRAGRLNLGHRIDVADASGGTIGTVYFRDAVDVRD
jgi:hypothetical protein